MGATTEIDKEQANRILLDSIDVRCRLMLTIGGSGGWETYKCAFLSRCNESRTLSVKVLEPSAPPARVKARPGDRVGVTFRIGHRKCMFAAPFVSLARDSDSEKVILGWPDQVHFLRRRAYERVKPPNGRVVPVRLTLVGSRPGSPAQDASDQAAIDVIHGQLVDLSAGGLRVAVADGGRFEPGSTYRCSLAPRRGRAVIVFDTIVRHRGTSESGRPTIGLQIVGLEAAPDGSTAMDRLVRVVTYFQRAGSRRKRTAAPALRDQSIN